MDIVVTQMKCLGRYNIPKTCYAQVGWSVHHGRHHSWDWNITHASNESEFNRIGFCFPSGLSYINAQPSKAIDLDWDSIVWTPIIATNRNSLMRFELSCPDDGDAFLSIYTTNSLGVIATKLAGYCGNATLVNGTQAFQAQTVCLPAGSYALSIVAYSSKGLPLYIRNVTMTGKSCNVKRYLTNGTGIILTLIGYCCRAEKSDFIVKIAK